MEPEEHIIINHMYLVKGKCYDTADLYRQETRGEKTVYFTNSPTTYIGQYVGNSWDHTTGPAPLEKIYYFKDRDTRTNSLTHNWEDPWLYFREVPCPRSNVLDENTNNKKIPTLKNLALKEVLNNISTSEIKNLPIGNNINTNTDNPYASEPLIASAEWKKNRVRLGGKKYIKKSRKIRKIRKIRKSKKIRKSRKSRKSKY